MYLESLTHEVEVSSKLDAELAGAPKKRRNENVVSGSGENVKHESNEIDAESRIVSSRLGLTRGSGL